MKCDICHKPIDEIGVLYDISGKDLRHVCPRCFIISEKHGIVHVLFHWGLDDEVEAEG